MPDVVQIGPHVLVHGGAEQCLGNAALALPAYDRLMADPPYDFDASGGGAYRKARPQGLDQIDATGLADGFDQEWLISELWRTQCPGAMIFCHNDQVGRLEGAMHTPFRRVAILEWHKTNPQPVANKHYLPDTEFLIHGWNPGAHPDGRSIADLRRYIETPVGRNEFGHPTQKPLDVMMKFVRNLGGRVICDPYMGTGSTGVAAIGLGKSFLGIERERQWFDIAVQRIGAAWQAADQPC